ncbi:MAG: DNA mismatch repair protein MutS, partial [Sphingomonadales bacterium]
MSASAKSSDQVTPMMAQFLEIKDAHKDYLLFYRMGDFYELFFDDAVKAAEALDIQLTKRGNHLGEPIPMCGVPVHAADTYLARLIRKNFKVAVAEQMEDPAEAKKRGSKAVVKREVIRLVTPGTLTEDTLLDARQSNFLVAIARAEAQMALAWLDMSTGRFRIKATDVSRLDADLARLAPQEVLAGESLCEDEKLSKSLFDWRSRLTKRPNNRADSQGGENRLKEQFKVSTLDGFGEFTRAQLGAAGLLLDYVVETQKGQLPFMTPPVLESGGAVMTIDAATRRSLELNASMMGDKSGSLIGTIDRTVTGAGARVLADWVNAPLTTPSDINARLDKVES